MSISPQQRFLLLLILVGALATLLGLVSRRARMLPYPAGAIVAHGVVLLSLVIQGGLIAPVARALRIEPPA